MSPDADRLARDIDAAYQRKVIGGFLAAHKAVALRAYAMLTTDSRTVARAYGSPVLSGRYRASHTIALGGADASVEHAPADPDEETIGARQRLAPPAGYAAGILAALEPFAEVVIANPLPYARRIEFGHSKIKAPDGVYELTAHALASYFATHRAELGGP
ncbi:MAG: hypothetical protein ACT4P2_13725 [Pseudomonadota bacterium]